MTDDQQFIRNDLRITCADAIELVTDYLESALNGPDLADFETHLGLCEGCQAFLDQIRATVTLTSETRTTVLALDSERMDELFAALDERGIQQPD